MMWLLLGYVGLVLADLEQEPPLFHIQDRGRSDQIWAQGVPYYLCYKYPRPWYYVEMAREKLSQLWRK